MAAVEQLPLDLPGTPTAPGPGRADGPDGPDGPDAEVAAAAAAAGVATDGVAAGWWPALHAARPALLRALAATAADVRAGREVLPGGDRVLRALGQPPEDVRVLVVGQDPYPTPGHAVGLSFAVEPAVRPLPP